MIKPLSPSEERLKQAEEFVRTGRFDEAIGLLTSLSKEEYPAAFTKLGELYLDGTGVARDDERAYFYFSRAAEGGDVEGEYRRGVCRQKGIGVEVDKTSAFVWLKKAAEHGHGRAQLEVGYAFLYGQGTEPDVRVAIDWIKRSLTKGVLFGYHLLYYVNKYGWKNEKKPDFPAAFRACQEGAKKGLFRSMTQYGDYFLFGYQNVKVDCATALSWYNLAIDKGDAFAVVRMGYCYEYGYGVPRDLPFALRLYDRAKDMGLSDGWYRYGRMYFLGKGVDKNIPLAIKCYRQAVDIDDNVLAMIALGDCLLHGVATQRNDLFALEWYKKATAKRPSCAKDRLAYCYRHGIGCEVNEQKAEVFEREYKVEAAEKLPFFI